jgi:hypothetical protein
MRKYPLIGATVAASMLIGSVAPIKSLCAPRQIGSPRRGRPVPRRAVPPGREDAISGSAGN